MRLTPLLPDLVALLLVVGGLWLVRRRGLRALWLATLGVTLAAWAFSLVVPTLVWTPSDARGFGASGNDTRWYPLGALAIGFTLQLAGWRAAPRWLAISTSAVIALLSWLLISGMGFWIS